MKTEPVRYLVKYYGSYDPKVEQTKTATSSELRAMLVSLREGVILMIQIKKVA